MTDKFIKENEEFVWRETASGLGYVYPKNAFWLMQEVKADEDMARFNNNLYGTKNNKEMKGKC